MQAVRVEHPFLLLSSPSQRDFLQERPLPEERVGERYCH